MIIVGKEMKRYEMMCPQCRTIFQFFDEDIQRAKLRIFDKVECPCCKKELYCLFKSTTKLVV